MIRRLLECLCRKGAVWPWCKRHGWLVEEPDRFDGVGLAEDEG